MQKDQKAQKPLKIIGNNTLVSIGGIDKIPAKVDTGADSSAVWASHIRVLDNGDLEFTLLDESHPLYTGEKLSSADFSVRQVRSSNGQPSIRYCVKLSLKIKGKNIHTNFTLADRSRNHFPVLIGRKTIQNKFLVDVSKTAVRRPRTPKSDELTAELRDNHLKFHQKYMEQ